MSVNSINDQHMKVIWTLSSNSHCFFILLLAPFVLFGLCVLVCICLGTGQWWYQAVFHRRWLDKTKAKHNIMQLRMEGSVQVLALYGLLWWCPLESWVAPCGTFYTYLNALFQTRERHRVFRLGGVSWFELPLPHKEPNCHIIFLIALWRDYLLIYKK